MKPKTAAGYIILRSKSPTYGGPPEIGEGNPPTLSSFHRVSSVFPIYLSISGSSKKLAAGENLVGDQVEGSALLELRESLAPTAASLHPNSA
jgi:hypothetical protein